MEGFQEGLVSEPKVDGQIGGPQTSPTFFALEPQTQRERVGDRLSLDGTLQQVSVAPLQYSCDSAWVSPPTTLLARNFFSLRSRNLRAIGFASWGHIEHVSSFFCFCYFKRLLLLFTSEDKVWVYLDFSFSRPNFYFCHWPNNKALGAYPHHPGPLLKVFSNEAAPLKVAPEGSWSIFCPCGLMYEQSLSQLLVSDIALLVPTALGVLRTHGEATGHWMCQKLL